MMSPKVRANLAECGRRAREPEHANPARWQWKVFDALCWQIAELKGLSPWEVKEAARRAWRGDYSYAGLSRLNTELEEYLRTLELDHQSAEAVA